MINPLETIQFKVGLELLTVVVPINKTCEIQDAISKLDWSSSSSFARFEKILLKSNGFIREH